MKIEGEYVFEGEQEDVWKLVRDPEVLASCLPGTQSLQQVGENEYAGEIKVRIGPISGAFAGKIFVTNEVPPVSCTLTVEGIHEVSPPGDRGTRSIREERRVVQPFQSRARLKQYPTH